MMLGMVGDLRSYVCSAVYGVRLKCLVEKIAYCDFGNQERVRYRVELQRIDGVLVIWIEPMIMALVLERYYFQGFRSNHIRCIIERARDHTA